MANDEVPGSGLSVPCILFQQEIDLELYMERMVMHQDLTGLQSLAVAETAPNAVVVSFLLATEALKDAQLQGNTKIAKT